MFQSVRALAIDDVVPPNTKNDLKEAFDAAVQYLKAKGLTKVCKPSLIMLSSFPSGEWALKKCCFAIIGFNCSSVYSCECFKCSRRYRVNCCSVRI